MSKAAIAAITPGTRIVDPSTSQLRENKILQYIRTHNNEINYLFNGGASLVNLLTYLSGNFPFLESLREKLEVLSGFYTKCATGMQGFLQALENYKRENLLPLIGNILEIPVAVFSTGYNLWLYRGIAQGISQFQRILEKRPLRDKDGNPISGKYLTRDFSKGANGSQLGWMGGMIASIKEMPKILKELIQDPKNKIKDSTNLMYFASLGQISGALIAMTTGLDKLGSAIRNIGGTGVDISLILDKNIKTQLDTDIEEDNKKKSKTDYTISGCTWLGSELVDFFKRFEFFSSKAECLTNLSLFFDRAAATFMTKGNLAAKNKAVL